MTRRRLLQIWAFPAPLAFAENAPNLVRGKLRTGTAPAVEIPGGLRTELVTDKSSARVLVDRRLEGLEVEVSGRQIEPGRFEIGPFHLSPVRVIRDGKRLVITYWCETCSIRSLFPDLCVCCWEPTDLDLREKFD